MISASSSATTRTSFRSIPILVRYSAIKPMFLSLVRPDRISSPITRMPAVTISLITSPCSSHRRSLVPLTLLIQRLEVTAFCSRISHPAATFSGTRDTRKYQMPRGNAYRAGPGLATIPFSHALCVHDVREQSGSMAVAFDEMNGPGGDLRPAYHELSRWLKETPPDALEYRRPA